MMKRKLRLEALKIDSQNKAAGREREILEKVKKPLKEKILNYRHSQSTLTSKNSIKEKTDKYKILSFDSCGIRTLLPALWLSEIERRTNKPICSSFIMIVGASLAGFIAAGLSKPVDEEKHNPQYSASNILEFFLEKPESFFGSSGFDFSSLEKKKMSFFQGYFGKTSLSQTLNSVVIPVVRGDNYRSDIFNSYDAIKNPFSDEEIVDILKASSFSSTDLLLTKKKKKNESFYDGRVLFANPSIIAYDEAIRYGIPKENIFMLSLGTGNYVPDPCNLEFESEYCALKKRFPNIPIVFGQEEKADTEIYAKLGNENYQR